MLVYESLALAKRLTGYAVGVIAGTSAKQGADGDQHPDGGERHRVTLHTRCPDGSPYHWSVLRGITLTRPSPINEGGCGPPGEEDQAAAFSPGAVPMRASIAAALRRRICSRASSPISASASALRVQSQPNSVPSVPHTIRSAP